MAIRKNSIGERIATDMKERDLGQKGMRKYSVFLSEGTVSELKRQLPGLSTSTGIRFTVEQYLKDHR